MKTKWAESRTGRLVAIMHKLIEEHGISYVGAAYGLACNKYSAATASPPRKAKAKDNGRRRPPHLERRTEQ
jgi:hypothetical protein